jgi:hypothetical protein
MVYVAPCWRVTFFARAKKVTKESPNEAFTLCSDGIRRAPLDGTSMYLIGGAAVPVTPLRANSPNALSVRRLHKGELAVLLYWRGGDVEFGSVTHWTDQGIEDSLHPCLAPAGPDRKMLPVLVDFLLG